METRGAFCPGWDAEVTYCLPFAASDVARHSHKHLEQQTQAKQYGLFAKLNGVRHRKSRTVRSLRHQTCFDTAASIWKENLSKTVRASCKIKRHSTQNSLLISMPYLYGLALKANLTPKLIPALPLHLRWIAETAWRIENTTPPT